MEEFGEKVAFLYSLRYHTKVYENRNRYHRISLNDDDLSIFPFITYSSIAFQYSSLFCYLLFIMLHTTIYRVNNLHNYLRYYYLKNDDFYSSFRCHRLPHHLLLNPILWCLYIECYATSEKDWLHLKWFNSVLDLKRNYQNQTMFWVRSLSGSHIWLNCIKHLNWDSWLRWWYCCEKYLRDLNHSYSFELCYSEILQYLLSCFQLIKDYY